MNTEIRLGSVIEGGVHEPEAHAIEYIYMALLHDFEQDIYRRIGINQIGDDLDELIMKQPGNKIHINIKYPAIIDFNQKSPREKNIIMLDVIHTSLLRIAAYDKKLDAERLEKIRMKILEADFSFEFVCRNFINNKFPELIGKVIVQPFIDRFVFSVVIEESDKVKCRVQVLNGRSVLLNGDAFFGYGKWEGKNQLVIWGTEKIVETHIEIVTCSFSLVNLTSYKKSPYFELMKVDISDEERAQATKDWEHSLPPAIAASIRQANN